MMERLTCRAAQRRGFAGKPAAGPVTASAQHAPPDHHRNRNYFSCARHNSANLLSELAGDHQDDSKFHRTDGAPKCVEQLTRTKNVPHLEVEGLGAAAAQVGRQHLLHDGHDESAVGVGGEEP